MALVEWTGNGGQKTEGISNIEQGISNNEVRFLNPFSAFTMTTKWIPAFAGMTTGD